MIEPFITLSLLVVSVIFWIFIKESRIRKDPLYKQKEIEAENRRQEAFKLREEEEKKNKIDKELQEQRIHQQVAYNTWMREVYHYTASSFQISDNEYKNGPYRGPWASALFNDDVRAYIDSQDVPLHNRANIDIEEEKYRYSPQGLEEGQIIIDIFLNKGPKAAEVARNKMEKNRRL